LQFDGRMLEFADPIEPRTSTFTQVLRRLEAEPMPNRLIDETSPYLLQHANNPVEWYPWGDEALARARAEDRPILLSIGYSACHWRSEERRVGKECRSRWWRDH